MCVQHMQAPVACVWLCTNSTLHVAKPAWQACGMLWPARQLRSWLWGAGHLGHCSCAAQDRRLTGWLPVCGRAVQVCIGAHVAEGCAELHAAWSAVDGGVRHTRKCSSQVMMQSHVQQSAATPCKQSVLRCNSCACVLWRPRSRWCVKLLGFDHSSCTCNPSKFVRWCVVLCDMTFWNAAATAAPRIVCPCVMLAALRRPATLATRPIHTGRLHLPRRISTRCIHCR